MSSLSATRESRVRRLPGPLLQGLLPIERAKVPAEVIAGITLAALAIPEVMGYSDIAGMPVITGLYTMLLPVAVFAVFGSSRHLVVGADSATAAIMFAALTPLAAAGSPEYVALAGMLALFAGGFLLAARVFRLGFLANFLSRTVLVGFLTGVGIQVACGQLAGMFGYARRSGGPAAQVYDWARHLAGTSLTTLAVATAVLLVIVAGTKLLPKVPWALLAVVGATAASALLSLSSHGVATLGTMPSGLPQLAWPSITVDDFTLLVPTAASIFVVVLAQSAATSRAYAARFRDDLDENVDLVGLGLANLSAGVTGAFVVNGSPTKTEMVDEAGGRSQLAQLTAAAVVLVVLMVLTRPLGYLPDAVLAAVVFLIGVKLVDLKGMRRIYRLRPVEFAVALITAVTVVFVGVEQGIVLAIALSVIAHLRHSYRPDDRLLVRSESGAWKPTPLQDGAQAAPGLAVYRFGASIYYANAWRLAEETRAIVAEAEPPLEWLCLVAEAVIDLDYSGSAVLRGVVDDLRARGVRLVLCEVTELVKTELDRDGLTDLIGADGFFAGVDDVYDSYVARALGDDEA